MTDAPAQADRPAAPGRAAPPTMPAPEPAPAVSILVVSYQTREMTLECLASIARETRASHEVIVVDNASSDGSAEAIAEAHPEVRLLAETENHGFARANNIAARHARGDHLLLLNPDTVILDGAVDRLLDFARETPRARIWGGRTVFADGRLNPTSCWRRMSVWNVACRSSGLSRAFPRSELLNSEGYGGWDRGSRREVDIVTGCFLMIGRADWEALGGFDPAFVMYGEEADLCLRAARDLRARPAVTPEATIVHHGGAADRVAADRVVRTLRAKAELLERHLPAWQRPLARPLFRAWPLGRGLMLSAAARLGRGGAGGGHRHAEGASGEGAAVWREVWSRRAEWQGGFGPRAGS
jgi:GT2 family glycosyltransferase